MGPIQDCLRSAGVQCRTVEADAAPTPRLRRTVLSCQSRRPERRVAGPEQDGHVLAALDQHYLWPVSAGWATGSPQ
jgi:hypothetical protein